MTGVIAAILLAVPGGVRVAAANVPTLPADVQVMAWPGGLGIPKVIGWASTTADSGISWGTTASITAANAYVTYDGTNGVWNVPATKGFSFKVANVASMTIDSIGNVTATNDVSALDYLMPSNVNPTPGAGTSWMQYDGTRVAINAATGTGINLQTGGSVRAAVSSLGAFTLTPAAGAGVGLTLTETASTSGASGYLTVTGAASTNQTLSTEINFVKLNLAQTVQWATGALATERAVLIQAPTLAFVGASTVTNAATLDITAAPSAGLNATITNAWALRVEAGASSFPGGVQINGSGQFANANSTQFFDAVNNTWRVGAGTGIVNDGTASTIAEFKSAASTAGATTGHISVPAIQWPTAGVTAPAATEPYIDFDGTNGVWNVPATKGFSFNIGGVAKITAPATGAVTISSAALSVGGNVSVAGPANAFNWSGTQEIRGNAGAGNGISILGNEANGATAIGVKIDNATSLTTAGAKLASFQNAAVERLAVDLSGALLLTNNSATAPASTNAYLQYDGTNLVQNVPTGKGILFSTNGSGPSAANSGSFQNGLFGAFSNGTGNGGIEFGTNAGLGTYLGAPPPTTANARSGFEYNAGGINFYESPAAGVNNATVVSTWSAANDAAGVVAYTFSSPNTLTATSKALLLVQNNATDAFSVQPGGAGGSISVSGVTAVKTAAYTATKGDSLVLADPNAAVASFAVTLPAANIAKGAIITVKVVAIHATRVITVVRAGTDTIEGVSAGQTTTTFGTTANLASATFQSDGVSKWYLISSNGSVT